RTPRPEGVGGRGGGKDQGNSKHKTQNTKPWVSAGDDIAHLVYAMGGWLRQSRMFMATRVACWCALTEVLRSFWAVASWTLVSAAALRGVASLVFRTSSEALLWRASRRAARACWTGESCMPSIPGGGPPGPPS